MINLITHYSGSNNLNPRAVGGALALVSFVAFGAILSLSLTHTVKIRPLYSAIPGGLALLFVLDLINYEKPNVRQDQQYQGRRSSKRYSREEERGGEAFRGKESRRKRGGRGGHRQKGPQKQSDTPLPDLLEAKCVQVHCGEGYPDPFKDGFSSRRKKVTAETIRTMKEIDLKPYHEHLQAWNCKSESKAFFPEGVVVQTVGSIDFDRNYEPFKGEKKVFMVHHACAYNMGNAEEHGGQPRYKWSDYFDLMEAVFKNVIVAQAESGAEHVIWNYFGMGAFFRNSGGKFEQRLELATRLTAVIDEHLHEATQFYMVGPTGQGETEEWKAREPRANYNAFVKAFDEAKTVDRIHMCPQTDILEKANVLAQQYPDYPVAPVSIINAANQHRLGNHWFNPTSANRAIDENIHRRSSLIAACSEEINGSRRLVQEDWEKAKKEKTPLQPLKGSGNKVVERVRAVKQSLAKK